MARVKAILSAGAIVLGTISGSYAADLLPPPPPIEPPPAPNFGGWYIRGDVGAGINDFSDARSTLNAFNSYNNPPPAPINRVSTDIGGSGIVDVGIGYQVNNWFRGDVTGEYRTSAAYRSINTYPGSYDYNYNNSGHALNYCGQTFCQDSYSANISSGVFLANGYVDVGTWYGVTPFFGAGVGVAVNKFGAVTDGSGGYSSGVTSTNLAWAAMAGLGFNITPNLKLEVSYRYLDMGRLTSGAITCGDTKACWFEKQTFKLSSNDIRIGFRYMFADYTPPAPPLQPIYQPPLVRKY